MRRQRKRAARPSASPSAGPSARASVGPDAEAGTRLRAKSPADLIGVVPYLLGFHPSESVVLLLLSERRVVMTARMDFAELTDPRGLAGYLDEVRRGQGAVGVVTITYSRSDDAWERTAALADEIDPAVLVDAMLADGERWWSVLCNGSCCPPEGTPYDLGSNPLSAAAVYAGLNAMPDRSSVAALVAGPSPDDVPALELAVDEALDELIGTSVGSRKRLVRRLVQQTLDAGQPPSDAECARLAVLVHHLHVRDVAWAQLTRERAAEHVALWQRVVSRTPAWLASAPLCLLGISAWVAGNGTLQNCCVERVERIDPEYSMASLLADINQRALPPSYWDELLREFRKHPDMLAG